MSLSLRLKGTNASTKKVSRFVLLVQLYHYAIRPKPVMLSLWQRGSLIDNHILFCYKSSRSLYYTIHFSDYTTIMRFLGTRTITYGHNYHHMLIVYHRFDSLKNLKFDLKIYYWKVFNGSPNLIFVRTVSFYFFPCKIFDYLWERNKIDNPFGTISYLDSSFGSFSKHFAFVYRRDC